MLEPWSFLIGFVLGICTLTAAIVIIIKVSYKFQQTNK